MVFVFVRKVIFLASFLLPCLGFAQLASSLPEKVMTADHGAVKSYVIAADEIARQQEDGRFKVETANTTKVVKGKPDSADTRMVLYPEGEARTLGNQRLLTERIVAEIQPGTNIAALVQRQGIIKWEAAAALENHYVFSAKSAQTVLRMLDALRAEPGVVSAEFLLARQQSRRARPNDPLFGQQWFLRNVGQTGGLAGIDAGVVNIWGNFNGAGIRGRGVVVGIVDDGVQFTHPDIKPNYDTTLDYDWNDNTHSDPSPSQENEDFHGTSVAGVAAARGGNRIGVSGVAPQARLTGLRLIAGYEDDADEGAAFLHKSPRIFIKNNSWGPTDDGRTMEAPGPIASAAFAKAARVGRNGRGTIFTWAAGNGRAEGDNSNYDGYANSIYTIAVTTVNDRGKATYYGEGGANVLIAAPSDDDASSGIVTTDLSGNNGYNYSGVRGELGDTNYTRTFGGTSSATPVISGVAALMLQANPRLGWRDVQEILIRTATKNDAGSKNWVTNAAGFHFHPDFGAGLVQGTRAVHVATKWVNLGAQTSETESDKTVAPIPDGNFALTRTFVFPSDQRVEHATVKLNISHASRGQLRIILTSPSGTVSELASRHNDPSNNISWTYMTVRNWGESSAGTWTLRIEDSVGGVAGTYNSADLTLFGTSTAAQ